MGGEACNEPDDIEVCQFKVEKHQVQQVHLNTRKNQNHMLQQQQLEMEKKQQKKMSMHSLTNL